MQLYLIINHFNSSFVFTFAPPLSIGPQPWRDSGTLHDEGVNTYNNHNTHGCLEGRRWFFFYPSHPTRKVSSPLTNTCNSCHHFRVVGGVGGRGRCCPRLPLRPPLPFPIPSPSANSDLHSTPRALCLLPQPRPQPHPCPLLWPQPPPKLGLSGISPPPWVL